MDIEAKLPRHPFLTFAEQLTQQPLIREALVRLEDEQHLCANLLIYIIWLAVIGKGRLTQSLSKRLIAAVAPWHVAISKTLHEFAQTVDNNSRTKSLLTSVNPLLDQATASEQQILLQTPLGLNLRARNRQQQLHDACCNIATCLHVLQTGLDDTAIQALNVIFQAIFPECPAAVISDAINQALMPSQLVGTQYTQLSMDTL